MGCASPLNWLVLLLRISRVRRASPWADGYNVVVVLCNFLAAPGLLIGLQHLTGQLIKGSFAEKSSLRILDPVALDHKHPMQLALHLAQVVEWNLPERHPLAG